MQHVPRFVYDWRDSPYGFVTDSGNNNRFAHSWPIVYFAPPSQERPSLFILAYIMTGTTSSRVVLNSTIVRGAQYNSCPFGFQCIHPDSSHDLLVYSSWIIGANHRGRH